MRSDILNQLLESAIMHQIMQHVKNGLLYVNRDGFVEEINERACVLVGLNRDEALGKHVFEIFDKTGLIRVMEENRMEEDVEFPINDNRCRSTRIPIRVGDEVVGALAIFDDVTHYEALNRAWEEDKTENSILKTVLELAYDGIIVVDKNGYITMISNAYKIFLGVEDQDCIGKHVTEVIENTRMHIVTQTGIPEINDVQQLKGNYIVANRIPYYNDGELAGVIGKVLFRNMSELDAVNKKVEAIENELASYKSELVQAHKVKYNLETIITKNFRMNQLKKSILKIAKSDSNVTIIGESGTGKELFAHSIHGNSMKKQAPFVKVNCAAIPEHLLEAELFGYEKGAFTGANTAKMGKFEVADGGTLFLDEIGDMPLQMQAKILRTLQEGEVERIGSNQPKTVDVRIISATNRDLKEMIEDKTFREDLYYRINVINIGVFPLRERKEDIIAISNNFIDYLNRNNFKQVRGLSNKAVNVLLSYDWPGNVRELKNVIERAYHILEGESFIEPWHLPGNVKKNLDEGSNIPLKVELGEIEKKIIIDRLNAFNGNKTKAAANLGISRMALHKKIEKYGLK